MFMAEAGCTVAAIDPGALHADALAHPGVTHLRVLVEEAIADGSLQALGPFDGVVCDMNIDPRDAARLMAQLAPFCRPGACLVLTLKLPRRLGAFGCEKMKEECAMILAAGCGDSGGGVFSRRTHVSWLFANSGNERTLVAGLQAGEAGAVAAAAAAAALAGGAVAAAGAAGAGGDTAAAAAGEGGEPARVRVRAERAGGRADGRGGNGVGPSGVEKKRVKQLKYEAKQRAKKEKAAAEAAAVAAEEAAAAAAEEVAAAAPAAAAAAEAAAPVPAAAPAAGAAKGVDTTANVLLAVAVAAAAVLAFGLMRSRR
jgi:hypothetical protein